MTLNHLKLTSHIINKFAEQVMPSSSLRIDSKEKFEDKSVYLTDHAHSRLNERLELNKEKVEYAQFIRSIIYGTTKTFVTYKNEKIFIANTAFGEVDMTLAFTNTSDDKNYLLLTAFINSTSRFIEFMKKEYQKESKIEQVEKILKDSLFKGKSSEEFFDDFEKQFGLIKDRTPEQKKSEKTYKKIKRVKQSGKEIYSEKLDEKYAQELLKTWGLDKADDFVIKREKPFNKKPQLKQKTIVNKETKLHNRNYDEKYAD